MIPEFLKIDGFEQVIIDSAFPLQEGEYSVTFITNRHPGVLIGKTIFLGAGGTLKLNDFYRDGERLYFICTAKYIPK